MVEERASAVDAERKTNTAENLLKGTALGIGAVKDGDRTVGIALVVQALHFVSYPECLEVSRESFVHGDGVTDRFLGENFLGDLVLIVRYDLPCSLDDGLCGAIVALELEGARCGEGLLKAEDVI